MQSWSDFAAEHPVHHSFMDARTAIMVLAAQGGACHGMSFVDEHTFCVNNAKFLHKSQDHEYYYIDWPLPTDADVISNICVEGVDKVTFVCGARYQECPLDEHLTFIRAAAVYSEAALRLWWRDVPARTHEVTVQMTKTLFNSENRKLIIQTPWTTGVHDYSSGVVSLTNTASHIE